ncbi:MAG TPA: metallophosphoesterase [Verrucomicrobiae bacterium]|nr:metallophosphoesterase [Verrucomicrobiae bacterium]
MPLLLPQLSRREFLKRAALAGAAAAFAPSSYAGLFGKSREKNTFVFFSDTHIAADAALKQGVVNMADHLAACVRELAAWPVKPAAVIVNGDLAFKTGLAGDYVTFGKMIDPVRAIAPMHLSLGNHDDREQFWAAFPHDALRLKSVPQKQVAIFSSERANWFLLDSLDQTNSTPGELGVAQLAWLAQELAARPDKPAIIVGHHNLQAPGAVSGLKDSAALEELFAQHRQVKAYICGHTHNWHVEPHASGVQLINLPPTGYVFKEGRPSGWVRCTLGRDGAEFELRSLDAKHPEHAQVKRLEWRTA